MNYMDVAENEHLLIIVLRMMLISQMSEDEVEAVVDWHQHLDLTDIYGYG